jgi:hypothetical protein
VTHFSKGKLEVHHSLSACSLAHIRHSAAVLSFAIRVTLVGNVLAPITGFLMHWVKTHSDFDTSIAVTMTPEWIREYRPVLSQRDDGHVLYSMWSYGKPKGMVVICHRMCRQNIKFKASGGFVRHTCQGCNSVCFTPEFLTDRTTVLGRRVILKTAFPQEQYPTEWELPKSAPTNPPRTTVQPPSISSNAVVHPPSSGVEPQLSTTPSPASSSSLRITIPPRLRGPTPAISRSQSPATPAISPSPSQSTSGTVSRHDATPTPPPPSPLEPPPAGPHKRKSTEALNTRPRLHKMRKNQD